MKKKLSMAFIVFAIMSLALAASPVFGGNGDGLDDAIAAQERHNDELMANPGVVGTAVGHGPESRGAVFVFAKSRGVPGIPEKVDGIPVITFVTGEIFARHHCKGRHADDPACENTDPPPGDPPAGCSDTTENCRPAPLGFSTGHPAITAGTFGARLTDGTNVYALSNNHVYANSNAAAIGDEVIQPGAFDGGSLPGDKIGDLSAFVRIVFSTSAANIVDGAVAISQIANLGNSTPEDGYGTPESTTVQARLNSKLQKYGRTTGQTQGQVWAVNSTVDVNYGKEGIARFMGQIVARGTGFSRGGDSGSRVVQVEGRGKNKSYRPVGLLFAGNNFSELTWLNPIDTVLSELSQELGGGVTLTIDGR